MCFCCQLVVIVVFLQDMTRYGMMYQEGVSILHREETLRVSGNDIRPAVAVM